MPRKKKEKPPFEPMVHVSFRVPPEVLRAWQVNEPDFRKRLQRWMIRHQPRPIGAKVADREKQAQAAAAMAAFDEAFDEEG